MVEPINDTTRNLISRMADELDHYRQLLMDDRREIHALATEARAALAADELAAPTERQLLQLAAEFWPEGCEPAQATRFARAALARRSRPRRAWRLRQNLYIRRPMTTNRHPITPPPVLVGEWLCNDGYPWDPSENATITITTNRLRNVATQAARWGYDQAIKELETFLEKGNDKR